jgi:hypothetical protein
LDKSFEGSNEEICIFAIALISFNSFDSFVFDDNLPFKNNHPQIISIKHFQNKQINLQKELQYFVIKLNKIKLKSMTLM